MISYQTAYDIAATYREIEHAEKLLDNVRDAVQRRGTPDIRDAFGRPQGGLQLGVPAGENSTRLYQVEWPLCIPVLMAHIGQMRAKLAALNEVARAEIDSAPEAREQRENA